MTPVRSRSGAVALLVGGLLAGGLAGCTSDSEREAAPEAASSAAETRAPEPAVVSRTAVAAGDVDIPALVARVDPSVVTVVVSGSGLGSGVVYRTGGIIVTNAHVVEGARQVEIELADGTRTPAEVVAVDEETDLAVLRAARTNLPPVKFQSVQPRVGELVLAMGSPLGFQNSVTAGIVSGLGREIPGSASQGGRALVDLMQTDAAISPGNSGGALVNGAGEIVGINEAYLPPSSGAVNLGFAIPATTVIDVVDQLLETGVAIHPYLGINAATLTPEIADALGLAVDEGVLVTGIPARGPATAAGIAPGDVMLEFNGKTVRTSEQFLGELRGVKPGQKVTVKIQRGRDTKELPVTIGEKPVR
jgi:S1-C subfamily serine protease